MNISISLIVLSILVWHDYYYAVHVCIINNDAIRSNINIRISRIVY